MTHPPNPFHSLPNLLVSDAQGHIMDVPDLKMAGASGADILPPIAEDLIPLPPGSTLYMLPDRSPVGIDPKNGGHQVLRTYQNRTIHAVGAFMAPAHTQILCPAYQTRKKAPLLPLYAYTAVGWKDGNFYVAAMRTDKDNRHDPKSFDDKSVNTGAVKLLRRYPQNRVVRHLVENCIHRYECPNAKNLALGRSEAPAPVSPVCNARCAGCISLQSGKKVSCAQERIGFVPTTDEIVEYAIPHLMTVKRALLSFGQGCEGEPLLQFNLIRDVIQRIRRRTSAGTLHINTNGSKPDLLRDLFHAGLDSVRISLNSGREPFYLRHFKPVNYTFADVLESLKLAQALGKWCSINYFVFPGFTDNLHETKAFIELLKETRVNFVQLRNLNMDPESYRNLMGVKAFYGNALGLPAWMKQIKKRCSWIRLGNYNPPKEDWNR